MEFSRPEYWSWVLFPSPGDLPNSGIEPWSLALQPDALLSEPPGKPKNTGMGSLSLLQGIFLTQKFNQGLLNCFPGGSDGKSICMQCGRPGFDSWVGKIPWRRKWQSTSVLLPGKSHGQRSLVGYSPWDCKEWT